ncbi:hypothetical protein IW140_001029 [Coemansia sp. RSA 1813]|nr:hypothetical protein EV178_004233 [Coemansia sp. RSA 1646]KAJ1770762.1 hypothetical protein LPJ74_002893 [Coemansia sp. RSA 1843]KAJ2091519.1 hypothetical protein IW138_001747 [Coemansia sp. RSA 986]KAJ2215180.1 hypothetical protein EV179_002399 [Coemansia sp. RSA 487]KAJ2572280.1 hypothetical protein IW140_001029 [Coemansia sp. RSA 1813]
MSIKVTIYRNRRVLLLLLVIVAVYLLFANHMPSSSLGNRSSTAPEVTPNIREFEPARPVKQDTKQNGDVEAGRAKDAAMRFLRSSMQKDRVVVFSKSTCPFCKATKDLLDKYSSEGGLSYKVIEVDLRTDAQNIRQALVSAYKRTTFPSIFVDSECLGGNDDIQNLERQGALAKLLKEKGLIAALAHPKPSQKDDSVPKEYTPSAVDIKVRRLIKDNRVMVFSKTYCPYSKRAKALLAEYHNERGLEFSVLEADLEPDSMAVKAALGRESSRLTFPNIFVDGHSIGGSDELLQKHQNGELVAMLKDRGLIV